MEQAASCAGFAPADMDGGLSIASHPAERVVPNPAVSRSAAMHAASRENSRGSQGATACTAIARTCCAHRIARATATAGASIALRGAVGVTAGGRLTSCEVRAALTSTIGHLSAGASGKLQAVDQHAAGCSAARTHHTRQVCNAAGICACNTVDPFAPKERWKGRRYSKLNLCRLSRWSRPWLVAHTIRCRSNSSDKQRGRRRLQLQGYGLISSLPRPRQSALPFGLPPGPAEPPALARGRDASLRPATPCGARRDAR